MSSSSKCSVSLLLLFTFLTFTGYAQQPDTTKKSAGAERSTPKPKPYKDVITAKAVTKNGFFLVHKVEDNYFFEIPNDMLNREILVVNRLSKTQAGVGYGGDQVGQNVIRFEKGPENKIFLRTISYKVYAKDSTSSMFSSVNNSNIQPIEAAFDIKAFTANNAGVVIDITKFIDGDNDVLFFNANAKKSRQLGSLQNDKSYIVDVKPYPVNIEITTVKTYGRTAATPGAPGSAPSAPAPTGNLTVEMNNSFLLLPKVPMQARYADDRVGYFTVGYTDFDANPQGVKSINMVKRWRLEPKPEDLEKYKRGELVEPEKPIVFYIDPATPKKWVSYLIQGVNDWQRAFEHAGFKNAVIGKMAPTKLEDSTWSLDDARNSAIVYKPSDIPNASGPSISDPRSGEIMESHINWYHNVMQLIRDWYLIQAAPSDARARQMIFPDELMGELIRFVSSHEVGHTLGLRHNFGSSSTVPVENLRNKAWVENNGHTPSIMDYARFNYVAQPEDNISTVGLFPRIGVYDNWAIEWAYRRFPEYTTPEAEKAHLNKWVMNKLKDRRLWWGDGESNRDDPRSQTEDLSDDAVKASQYGIKNLQRIVPQLMNWTREDNEDYSNLGKIYGQVTSQYNRYMGHVSRYVGGIYKTPRVVEDTESVYAYTEKSKQADAVTFLNQQLFTTPTWLVNPSVFDRTGGDPLSIIGNIQEGTLNRLFSSNTLDKLIKTEVAIGNNAYKMTDLFSDLKKGIWSELAAKKTIDVYRRNLQKTYISILDKLLNPAPRSTASAGGQGSTASVDVENSDIRSVVRAHLASLKTEVNAASAGATDTMTKFHLQDIAVRINDILDPKK